MGARAAGSISDPRVVGSAEAPERPPHRGPGDPRGAGDAGADHRADARAEAREPPQLLAAAPRPQRTTGTNEGVRKRAAVAARELGRPLPGRGGVRALVRADLPREAALRSADAGLHHTDPPPRALRGRREARHGGVRDTGARRGALRGRARRVRDPALVRAATGRRQRGRPARGRLAWRSLSGAGAPGRRARLVPPVAPPPAPRAVCAGPPPCLARP